MKTLTLSIKQKYFDEILAGKKTNETREIRPNNARKYIRYVVNGKEYEADADLPDGDVGIMPIKYDAVKLLTGAYKGKRPYLVAEVKDAKVWLLTDEKGEYITYEHDGEQYIAAQIEYTLGAVIEKSVN